MAIGKVCQTGKRVVHRIHPKLHMTIENVHRIRQKHMAINWSNALLGTIVNRKPDLLIGSIGTIWNMVCSSVSDSISHKLYISNVMYNVMIIVTAFNSKDSSKGTGTCLGLKGMSSNTLLPCRLQILSIHILFMLGPITLGLLHLHDH